MEKRFYPPWLIACRILGTAALVGSLATLARQGLGPSWLGLALIGAFFFLRVGSEWTLAVLYPDPEGRHRRSAILNTLIAIAVTACWFYLQRRGLRLG